MSSLSGPGAVAFAVTEFSALESAQFLGVDFFRSRQRERERLESIEQATEAIERREAATPEQAGVRPAGDLTGHRRAGIIGCGCQVGQRFAAEQHINDAVYTGGPLYQGGGGPTGGYQRHLARPGKPGGTQEHKRALQGRNDRRRRATDRVKQAGGRRERGNQQDDRSPQQARRGHRHRRRTHLERES